MKTITKKNREDQKIVRGMPPTHPGALLRDGILDDLEPRPTQHQLAAILGVSRQTVADLLAEKRNISPEMAYRLARAFGSTPELWMRMQVAWDLWKVKQDREKWAEIEKVGRMQAA